MSLLTPPSQFPVWADQDQVDPVSNQNNVTTPSAQKQQFGWSRGEFPPRNWFNWLARWTNRWLQYLAQNDSKSTTLVIQGVYGTSYKIADTATPGRLLILYIQDSSQGNAGDRFLGQCIPFSSSSSDRTVYPTISPLVTTNISVSQIDNATGEVTVTTSGGGSGFTMVVQQFLAS